MEKISEKVGLLGFGIIVKPIKEVEKTKEGIHIPNANKKSSGMRDGEVVAIGTSVEHIKIGDKVFYFSHLGTEMIVSGDKYIFLDIEKREVKGFYLK